MLLAIGITDEPILPTHNISTCTYHQFTFGWRALLARYIYTQCRYTVSDDKR